MYPGRPVRLSYSYLVPSPIDCSKNPAPPFLYPGKSLELGAPWPGLPGAPLPESTGGPAFLSKSHDPAYPSDRLDAPYPSVPQQVPMCLYLSKFMDEPWPYLHSEYLNL